MLINAGHFVLELACCRDKFIARDGRRAARNLPKELLHLLIGGILVERTHDISHLRPVDFGLVLAEDLERLLELRLARVRQGHGPSPALACAPREELCALSFAYLLCEKVASGAPVVFTSLV